MPPRGPAHSSRRSSGPPNLPPRILRCEGVWRRAPIPHRLRRGRAADLDGRSPVVRLPAEQGLGLGVPPRHDPLQVGDHDRSPYGPEHERVMDLRPPARWVGPLGDHTGVDLEPHPRGRPIPDPPPIGELVDQEQAPPAAPVSLRRAGRREAPSRVLDLDADAVPRDLDPHDGRRAGSSWTVPDGIGHDLADQKSQGIQTRRPDTRPRFCSPWMKPMWR